MKTLRENSRNTPIVVEADVVVCGGGPAGVAAAIASARAGARTTLIEAQGCLGGTWTTGSVSWILDHQNKSGLMPEIWNRLEALNGRPVLNSLPSNAFDIEIMKRVLDSLCLENGVEVHLQTWVAGVVCSGREISHVLVENKSGRQAFGGKVFIDTTGDGDVAAQAGCGFDVGHPETGKTQPMSMLALVAGLRKEDLLPFFQSSAGMAWGEPKLRLKEAMERGGHSPSYGMPTLFWIRDDLFLLMANHEYGVSGMNELEITRATMHGRQEVHELVNGLRRLGGVWSQIHIVSTSAQIGVREGRRIHGRYSVTADDMVAGRKQADAVCTVTFGIDVHSTDKRQGSAIEPATVRTQPYDIPLRALIARDVDGLMMAGRCISGDFLAHSSYRVTGNAVAMGEAAGLVSARAVASGCMPHEVSWAEVIASKQRNS